MRRRPNWSFFGAMALAAACWGLGTVISKGVLDHVPPLTLLVVQLATSLAFLWAVVLVQGVTVRFNKQTWRFALAGLLNPGLAYTFGLVGLAFTTATMSSLIWAAEPILILGLAWLILRERLTLPLLAMSLLAVIGVILVIGVSSGEANSGLLLGNMLVLIGVFCCAVYTVLARRMVTQLDSVLLVALQQTAALILAIIIWPLEWLGGETAGLAAISPGVWAWTVASGLVYYALAFWFYIIGLRQVPASLAALFLNLIPIFGVGGAYLFLGEHLTVTQWSGAALILVAVLAIVRLHRVEVTLPDTSEVVLQTSPPISSVTD